MQMRQNKEILPTNTAFTHQIHSTHVYNVVFLGYLYKTANEIIHFIISNEQYFIETV